MTVKTFAGVLLKAGRKARRVKRAKKALESGKKLKTSTLQTYITDAGLKKKKLSKLSRKEYTKAYNKEYNKSYKSLSKYQNRAGQTKLKDISRQQKATTHSGIEIKTQKGTHYGITGRTMKVNPGGFGAIVKRMPYVGSRESWGEEMSRMYGGVHMSQHPADVKKSINILLGKKKRKIKKKLKGGLLTKAIKTGFKQFRKETAGHKMHTRSRLKLKQDTKYIKTPELAPLGVHKIKPDDLRKLTIAQGLKIKIQKMAKTTLKHNKKAMPLLWGKAKNLRQVYKLDKYNKPNTERKLDKFFKDFTKLETYINKIKSKSATKHSTGGEIVIGKNVDRSLL
jgi:hypothetical protein